MLERMKTTVCTGAHQAGLWVVGRLLRTLPGPEDAPERIPAP
jgi:hypothetical protein